MTKTKKVLVFTVVYNEIENIMNAKKSLDFYY